MGFVNNGARGTKDFRFGEDVLARSEVAKFLNGKPLTYETAEQFKVFVSGHGAFNSADQEMIAAANPYLQPEVLDKFIYKEPPAHPPQKAAEPLIQNLEKITREDGSLPLYWAQKIAKDAEQKVLNGENFSVEDRKMLETLLEHKIHQIPAYKKPLEEALRLVNQGLERQANPKAKTGPSEKPTASQERQQETTQDFGAKTFPAKPPPVIKAEPLPPAGGQTKPQTQPVPPTEGNQTGILARISKIDGPRDYLRDLDSNQVKEMQRVLGVNDDGKWGQKTMAAAAQYIAKNNLPQNISLEDLQKHMQGVKPVSEAQQGYDEDRATHYAQEAAKIEKGATKEEFKEAHGNPVPDAAPGEPKATPSTTPVVRLA